MSEQSAALWMELRSLSVYRQMLDKPVTGALLRLLKEADGGEEARFLDAWGDFCARLIAAGRLDSLPRAIAAEVLDDDNLFSSLSSGHEPLPPLLEQAVCYDLGLLFRAASLSPADVAGERAASLPGWGCAPAAAPLDKPWDSCLPAIAAYHAAHGCGRFARHRAFLWRNGGMVAVEHPDPIRLENLKGYEYQRQIAVNNTLAFLNGFEANNTLLYGDRGTGKSSTVKALLNEYADQGLRMIEMPKAYLRELPDLTAQLVGLPMKFIVFIDDLSFASDDDNFAALKAVLEGGLSACPPNVLIYATSNRRHLLKEAFSDRQGDEIHHADTVQESVSLSDRFGISLTFLLPDKQRFLDIVEQIAADRGLEVDRQTLLNAAERWALERGARSPRYARQFVTDAAARLARGDSLG